jgi:NAD(P)-dependent dehydrogenase (short-subunit alcohol dehydrogenase family)
VYRSNLLGSDGRITNTGGGNTSAKLAQSDPLTGDDVEILWVKGSGGDLRTAKREHFSSLYVDKLRGLQHHYHHAPQRGPKTPIEDAAEAIDEYIALPLQEAFDIEYWLLEEAKLQRMPPEQELARQIIAVVGAGSGIGREVALRLAREGAHIVVVDRDEKGAQTTAKAITDKYGVGVGVAGSGISNCGPALGLHADITQRQSIRAMLDQVALAYGGLDAIAVTVGIFVPPDTAGRIPDELWAQTFAINVTGLYLVANEAATVWQAQGLPANLVLTTSANAVVAKKGSLAYDTSKAAANHLVRELAIELAPLIRVNGVAPATVVQGSAMFPRERVIASLAKYAIPYDDGEATEALTAKLAQFYANRTLLKLPITPADQAEAFFLLLSARLRQTTGQILAVDGGLHEAFLR